MIEKKLDRNDLTMKGRHIYTYIKALILMIAVSACEKNNEQKLTDYPIEMYIYEAETKALLDATTFATVGNQLHICDYYTPKDPAVAPTLYIDDQVKSQGATIWPFVNKKYSWTPDGVHKFYGWMYKDVNLQDGQQTAAAFFGSELQLDTEQKLTLPAKTIDQRTTQLDFMYSNIYERNLNNPNPDFMSPVELEFSHLFTAFSLAAKNMSENIDYRLRSVKIEGLVTRCTAVIDFSGTEKASVEYSGQSNDNGNGTADYSYTFAQSQRFVLSDELTDITTGNSDEQNREYKITWPMTAEQAGQVKITVEYDTGSDSSEAATKVLTLSEEAWEAGMKNNVNIVFIDKEVHLICTVEDWTYEEEEMQFTDVVTIHEDGKIRWEENSINSIDTATGEVVIKQNGDPAIAHFHIETPLGAIWHASLIGTGEGQVDAFEFVGPNYGEVGDEHGTIQIRARNLSDLAPTHKAILRITVTTGDGRTLVVNELAPSSASFKEYTIVQNRI